MSNNLIDFDGNFRIPNLGILFILYGKEKQSVESKKNMKSILKLIFIVNIMIFLFLK
jgi:hypothetical protein